mgnify:CR=1 FL=1
MRRSLALILSLTFVLVLVGCDRQGNDALAYSQEYVVGQGNIKGEVDTQKYLDISEDFAIGANQYGYAVFKSPDKAFEKMTELYADGIELIQTEFDLEKLTEKNYGSYKTYGWQVATGTQEQREQARFVTGFLDIYGNSFSKD